jgi:hypothetical protein
VRTVTDPEHRGEVILRGNIVNIPRQVAERLHNGEYRTCSVEIYEPKSDFNESLGLTLRRIALLGGTQPAVRRIRGLPPVEPMSAPLAFAEQLKRCRPGSGNCVLTFASRAPVTTQRVPPMSEVDKFRRLASKMGDAAWRRTSFGSVNGAVKCFAEAHRKNPAGTTCKGWLGFDETSAPSSPDTVVAGSPGDDQGPSREEMIAVCQLAMPGLSDEWFDELTDDQLKELINCLPSGPGDALDQQAQTFAEQPGMKKLSPNFLRTFRTTRARQGDAAARHILYGR